MDDAIRDDFEPAVPRFCPRCGAGSPGGGPSLCPDCGERLRPQGYCAICEGFWRRDVGAECPKHDVELVAEAPRRESFGDPGERKSLVTVATYSHPNQANAPRIRLEAEGIPTFLDGERVAGNTLYQVATGGVRLQVLAGHASAARILIAQNWALPAESGDDYEDAWDELAPEPGTRRRAAMKLAILIFLFGPAIVTVFSMLAHWWDTRR